MMETEEVRNFMETRREEGRLTWFCTLCQSPRTQRTYGLDITFGFWQLVNNEHHLYIGGIELHGM